MHIPLKYGERMQDLGWSALLGTAAVRGVNDAALQQVLASIPNPAANVFPNSEGVHLRIKAFDTFFTQSGFRSPLGQQFEMVRRKGLPPGSALVQALLLAEMSTGLLMGAQDADAIKGEVVYDLSTDGESFQGMRTTVRCREGEIVLRDADGIIAGLFQGPDHKTRLTKETENVTFFVFGVPGIEIEEIQAGIESIHSIFQSACSGFSSQILSRTGRE